MITLNSLMIIKDSHVCLNCTYHIWVIWRINFFGIKVIPVDLGKEGMVSDLLEISFGTQTVLLLFLEQLK